VQQALVAFTSIAVSDQIVMCHGARLDPAKPLSAYKLPVVSGLVVSCALLSIRCGANSVTEKSEPRSLIRICSGCPTCMQEQPVA
jgi:hypothetical protein